MLLARDDVLRLLFLLPEIFESILKRDATYIYSWVLGEAIFILVPGIFPKQPNTKLTIAYDMLCFLVFLDILKVGTISKTKVKSQTQVILVKFLLHLITP